MAEKWDFVEKRRKYNMLDKRSEDQIQRAYDRQKKGRTKGFLVLLVVYILMIGIVSLFLGNPIPHKETLLFFSIWDYGWIYTYPYLVVLCGVVGLAFSLIWIYYIILRDLIKIDEIVLQQCDVEMYLETMKYGVAYGKKLKFKGFQKSLFMLLQQRLSTALISNAKLEECRQFLTEEWIGKKNSSLYKLAIMNLDLVEAYYHLDTDKFNSLFQKAAPAFKKHKLFVAEQMFLEQKYEQTAAFLGTYKGKNPYNEVQRQYLLGKCFDKTGNKQMAEECMRYVSTHGNTMPCKKKAQEWILSNIPKRIESSITN